MNKATLVVMAAGIGSRFGGGIKQLEPVGPKGEIIMDYSIYDAIQAGFDKVVFVIRKDLEEDFRRIIGDRIEKKIKVEYAFQEVDDIPAEYKEKFAGRTKPWGTGQAILCCKDVVKEPFLVINADDYYGKEAYVEAFRELTKEEEKSDKMQISMVGFVLKNTLSENGGVNFLFFVAGIVVTLGIVFSSFGCVLFQRRLAAFLVSSFPAVSGLPTCV